MPKIRDIIEIIEKFAPLGLQEPYDNSGLMCGDTEAELTAALITLDTSLETINEAVRKGCNLIIEHHPSIFTPIKRIDANARDTRVLYGAIKNGITVYAAHTNVDLTEGGLCDYFAKIIGLKNIEADGVIRTGILEKGEKLSAYAERLKKILNAPRIGFLGDADKNIGYAAVINGSGGSEEYLLQAAEKKADVFISSDFKYHVLKLAKDLNCAIINVGHYESEIIFIDLIFNLLSDNGYGGYVKKSETNKPPYSL